ncbi:MAG: hypothetical protein A2V79_05720 [Betaproteobacteria bacterium RBG_16_56_24]|nr:MAG: hypothetical protein A2V79_05720 [Betaproteobacteria bacterium RBG_16_56_24]
MVIAWLALGRPLPASAAEEPAGSPEQPQLQLAPIRLQPYLGGNIDYYIRRDNLNGLKSRTQALTVTLNTGVDINSFIWQPWFAQVSGGLGLNTYLTDTGYNSGAGSTSNKSMNSAVTGKAALDIVPYSRFPFRTFYEKTDNRQNVGYASAYSASQNTHYGLSQQYRTLNGRSNYSAAFERYRWEGASFGVDKQRQANVSMQTALSPNSDLTVSGASNFTEHLGSNQSTLTNTLVARQSYRPAPTFTVENLANVGKTSYRLALGDNDNSYTQLSSLAYWSSSERPLTVTGSVRLSGLSNASPVATSRQSSANATLGASYQLSRQVRTYGNAGANLIDDKNGGAQSMTSYETAGADYQSDQTDLGKFLYSKHASGSLSNNTASSGSSQNLMLSAGHGISRSNIISSSARLDTNADQTASVNKSTLSSPVATLSHTGSLTWTIAGEGGTTRVRLNANDNRAISGRRYFFQLANLQANRIENMTRNTSLSGDLTIQATRQGTEGSPDTPTAYTSSASMNFAQQRVFGVPRMSFTSEVRIYGNNIVPVATRPEDQVSRSWVNRLNYSIGRLQMLLDASFSESNNIKQSSLMFKIGRAF